MTTVLVTGGTGFFGHNLVAALLLDDRVGDIHVYARNPPPTENRLSRWAIDGRSMISHAPEPVGNSENCRVFQSAEPNAIFANPRVLFFQGDICDEAALTKAAEGCTVLFHACGDTRWWNAKNQEQWETNVRGTTTAIKVMSKSPTLKRFIYTSTVDVMGHYDVDAYKPGAYEHLTVDGALDESWSWGMNSYCDFGYNYASTKREAERLVRNPYEHDTKIGANGGYIVIRAGSMLGPWDVTDQYGRLFGELKARTLAGIPCGGTSVCHVQDVARAHIMAAFAPTLEHDLYICAGINMTYRELFRAMRSVLSEYRSDNSAPIGGICGRDIIPASLLWYYGWFCELYANYWSGSEPEINPGLARYMSCLAYYNSDRAQGELGYPEQSLRWGEAISESYEWYRARGRF